MPTTYYEDGHGWGSFIKSAVKKVAPVLEYVPVVSTAIDVTNAATGRNWYEGGRPMSGAERLMALGGAGLGLIPGGTAGKAGIKGVAKGLDKANSARKVRKAEACPIGNSFTLDTPVLMADGTTRPIGDLEVGDLVWSTDPYTGAAGPQPITAVIDGEGTKALVEISTTDGQVIVATDKHPVFVVNEDGWVDATDLRIGDVLVDAEGDAIVIADLAAYTLVYEQVRNLSVAGFHTYHVGQRDAAWLVHNDGCGGVGPVNKGKDGVEMAEEAVRSSGGRVLGREITAEVSDSTGKKTRTRVDLLIETKCGKICFLEVKNGPRARLTRNQGTAFPSIRTRGFTPFGRRAADAGLPVGIPFGPIPVWVYWLK